MKKLTLSKVSFSIDDLQLCLVLDDKGRIWHLNFGPEPAPHFLKKLRKRWPFFTISDVLPQKDLLRFKRQIEAFLRGQSRNLDLPFFLIATEFEKKVLYTLCQIPYGEVRTYGWLAQKIGHPKAFRAVGRALATNPLPLIFPCHRIVGKHGLGGFSGGLALKRRLLKIEGLSL